MRLHGHKNLSMQKQLINLTNHVDPHHTSDVYGESPWLQEFENEIAQLLGKPAGVFMPSGTMAQQIALRIWAEKTGKFQFAMHETCHLEQHEHGAYKFLHQLDGVHMGRWDQTLSCSALESLPSPVSTVVIELPQRHNGGALPTWKDLVDMSAWCQAHQVIFHLDGARLWECTAYYKRSLEEICQLFDSVYVSFYKGLGGMGGAMLLGDADFIEESKIWLRRHGGNLITQYPYVLSARRGMEIHLPKMEEYYQRACAVAKLLNQTKSVRTTPSTPHTNMMHLEFQMDDNLESNFAAANQEIKSQCGFELGTKIWRRHFADRPISELYIGESALEIADASIEQACTILDQHLT